MTRRVVTGRGPTGKAAIFSDGEPPLARTYAATPGFADCLVWATAAPLRVPEKVIDPSASLRRWLPAPGESIAMTVTFPPGTVYADPAFDPDAARRESLQQVPGLAETFEVDHPGMHTTPTVDYAVVLSGSITLDLDDGETADLHAGDLVVQNGVRHAWRNTTQAPATLFFVLLGCKR